MSDLSWLANLPGQAVFKKPDASGNSGNTDAGSNYFNQNDPDLLKQYAQIKQYDPNARIVQGGENNTYSINFNQDMLPKIDHSMGRVPDAGWNARQLDHSGSDAILHSLIDPNNQQDSAYGKITPYSNITTQQVKNPDTSLLSTIGPMIPLLAAGGMTMLGGGAPGFGGLTAGGTLSGGGDLAASAGVATGSSPLGSAATKFAESVPGQLNNGKFNPASVTGLAGQFAGLPSWIVQLMQQSPALMQLLGKSHG